MTLPQHSWQMMSMIVSNLDSSVHHWSFLSLASDLSPPFSNWGDKLSLFSFVSCNLDMDFQPRISSPSVSYFWDQLFLCKDIHPVLSTTRSLWKGLQ